MKSPPLRHDPTGPDIPPPAHWRYRIEGSQKAFFSPASIPGPPHTGPIPQALCVYTTLLKPELRHQNPYSPVPQVLFRRYLGRYLIRPIPVHLSRSYLAQLALAAEPARPPSRRLLSSIACAPGHAELLPDLAFRFGAETVLVEIKPKCGVLSRSALVDPAVADALQKFRLPTYHLKNYLLRDGTNGIGKLPAKEKRYNPLHLLSGTCIREQLLALYEEKSRNLRVFHRGYLLADNFPGVETSLCYTALEVASRALSFAPSPKKSCLACLKEVQNMDYIDNIGAALLLERLEKEAGKDRAYDMIERQMFLDKEWEDDEDVKEAFRAAKGKICYTSSTEAARLHSRERYNRALKVVETLEHRFIAKMLADFLQAATARDCSVMVAMCRKEDACFAYANMASESEDFGVVATEVEHWLYSVHVVDVGAKSIKKIPDKWAARDLDRKNRIVSDGGLGQLT